MHDLPVRVQASIVFLFFIAMGALIAGPKWAIALAVFVYILMIGGIFLSIIIIIDYVFNR
jgi:hypothetical protein